jgi:hypothetical protein
MALAQPAHRRAACAHHATSPAALGRCAGVNVKAEEIIMPEQTKELATYDSQILSRSAEAGRELTLLMNDVPEADEDAYARIIADILGAQTPADLDAAWNANGIDKYADVALRVDSIHRMPSDFDEGLGMYLVVNAVIPGDGERVTVTTGSVSICAQLIKAFNLKAFPLIVIPRKSKRPTKAGYYPMHLEIVAAR